MKEHFHNRILYLKDDIYFLQIDGTVEVDTCLYQCCEVFLKILLRHPKNPSLEVCTMNV